MEVNRNSNKPIIASVFEPKPPTYKLTRTSWGARPCHNSCNQVACGVAVEPQTVPSVAPTGTRQPQQLKTQHLDRDPNHVSEYTTNHVVLDMATWGIGHTRGSGHGLLTDLTTTDMFLKASPIARQSC